VAWRGLVRSCEDLYASQYIYSGVACRGVKICMQANVFLVAWCGR
jgi:hypothetical protein